MFFSKQHEWESCIVAGSKAILHTYAGTRQVPEDPQTIFGMKIIIIDDHPVYRLPLDLPLDPTFRAEFNAWALAQFGVTNRFADGEVAMTSDFVQMNPRTYAQLINQISGQRKFEF